MKNSEVLVSHNDPKYIEKDLSALGTKLLSYDAYVEMGKELLKRVEVYQARIAFYACRICQIRHGGVSGKYYTLTDYAKDIGVNPKSLQQWTLTYRNVIEKLDIEVENITKEVWRTANRVNDNLTWRNRLDNKEKNTPRKNMKYKSRIPAETIRKMYEEESNDEPSFTSEVRSWSQTFRTIKSNIVKRDLSLAHEGNLIEIVGMLDFISDHINDYLTAKKKKK